MPQDAEVFSEDPEHSVARVPVDVPKGVFMVLVPDIPEARDVAVVSSPPGELGARTAASEIARFELRAGEEGQVR